MARTRLGCGEVSMPLAVLGTTRRRTLAGALGAACSGGQSAAPAREARGTLEFMTNQAAAPFAAVEAAIAAFRQQQPQIEVRISNVSAQYDDKLQTPIASGTPPDMFRVGGDQFARFYVLKVMLQLDGLFRRDKVDLSDFYPASLEQYKWTGKQFGMPSDYGYRMVYYNVDLLQKAGVPL